MLLQLMELQKVVLDKLIKDDKPRNIEGITSFGDIIFNEENTYGETVHSICQIFFRGKYGFSDGVEKRHFFFEIKVLGTTQEKAPRFFFSKAKKTLLKLSAEQREEIINRYGLSACMQHRLGDLASNHVYGYCTLDDYNSDNPFAEIVGLEQYHQAALEFLEHDYTRIYDEIWSLDSPDIYGSQIQKLYFGYGFELPKSILSCPNLRCLAIYEHAIKSEDLDFSRLKNLNELTLSNLYNLPDGLFTSLDQLKYLVSLNLSNCGAPRDSVIQSIPFCLKRLKVLRYFDYSGNKISDWSTLTELCSLKKLDISYTGISVLPMEISNLENLTNLNLSHNNLQELPESLKELTQLRYLNLSNNPLKKLPQWIGEMTQLEVLDVSQTQLKTLPESIVNLSLLNELILKKNPFKSLPTVLLKIPKKVIKLEERNKALYDEKIKAKMEKYPKGEALFDDNFNFKLLVIQKLMYEDEVLEPKFDVYDFVDQYTKRNIDIEEAYEIIPEVVMYFKNLLIPMELLIDIKELQCDGGDSVYSQLIPLWDGEDDSFIIDSVADVDLLPNLKRVNNLFMSKDAVKTLRSKKIKVSSF